MKKILFLAIATVAMTFAACGGKQQAADAIDPAAVAQMTDAVEVQNAANQAVEALQAQLENADKTQVEAVLAKAIEAANGLLNNGNVEGAAQYAQSVLGFVQENQQALADLGVDATNIIPSTLIDAATAATSLQHQVEDTCDGVQEQTQEQAEEVVEAAQQAAKQASQAAQQAVSNGAQQVNEAVNQAAQEAIRRIPGSQQ